MFDNISRILRGEEIKRSSDEYDVLLKNLAKTKVEISDLNANLNFITDPILLNQKIYELKAAETRYQYWFKLAKEMKISN